MKLHGLAVAAIPDKEDDQILNVICTPVSVTDKKRTDVQIEPGAFKAPLNTRNARDVMDCFMTVAGLVESLVNQQKQNLAEKNLPYRPVALEIGQDSSRPVLPNTLYVPLFNKVAFPESNYTLESQLMQQFDQFAAQLSQGIKIVTPFGVMMGNFPIDAYDLAEMRAQELEDFKHMYASELVRDEMLLKQRERLNARVSNARADILRFDNKYAASYGKACDSLSKSLAQCTLEWGDYVEPGLNYKKVDPNIVRVTDEDRKLAKLKIAFDQGSVRAHKQIIKLAVQYGRFLGREISLNPTAFALASPVDPKDPAMREKYPSEFFYEWHPEFRDALDKGYWEEMRLPNYIYLKMPTDQHMLPFVDPVANNICNEFEILEGLRAPDSTPDEADGRMGIITESRFVAESLGL